MTALSSLAGVSPQFIKQALSKAAALRQKFFFDSFFFQEKRMTASYVFFLLMGWRISRRPRALPSKGITG